MSNSRSDKEDNINNQFNLVMLGTDTIIESVNEDGIINRMGGYERGETLNSIFRQLKGAEYSDKHIVSGADTLGKSFNEKVEEGFLMVLKAISEGKNDIKITAHSRGAVETIIICHKLDKYLKNPKSDDNKICSEFDTKQETTSGEKTEDQKIDLAKLEKNRKNNINIEVFLMDPVPGQNVKLANLNGNFNWTENEFFKLPPSVKKATVVYQAHERTRLFEPVWLEENGQKEFTRLLLPGHHGSASGWLGSQDQIKRIQEFIDRDEKGLLKTRHVQKLAIIKIIDFIGRDQFKPIEEINNNNHEDIDASKDFFTSAEQIKPGIKTSKTINAYLNVENSKNYQAAIYNKILINMSEYAKYLTSSYSGLAWLSKEQRGIITANSYCKISEIPEFIVPFDFVNHDHLHLYLEANNIDTEKYDFDDNSRDYIIELLRKFTEVFNSDAKNGSQVETKSGTNGKGFTIKRNVDIREFLCADNDAVIRTSAFAHTIIGRFMNNKLTKLTQLDVETEKDQEKNQEKNDIHEISEISNCLDNLIKNIEENGNNLMQNDSHIFMANELKKLQSHIYNARVNYIDNYISTADLSLLDMKTNDQYEDINSESKNAAAQCQRLKKDKDRLTLLNDGELISDDDYENLIKKINYILNVNSHIEDQSRSNALVDELTKKVNNLVQESQTNLEKFEKQKKEMQKDNESLKKQLEVVKDTINSEQQKNKALQQSNQKLDADNSERKIKYEKQVEQITDLLNENEKLKGINQNLEARFDKTREALDAQSSKLSSAQSVNKELLQQQIDDKTLINSQKKDLDKKSAQLAKKDVQFEKLQTDQQEKEQKRAVQHSYEFQQNRIDKLIGLQVSNSPELKLLQSLSIEIKSLHKNQPESDEKLAKTLRLACDATESMSADGQHLKNLSYEADNYLNTSKHSRSSHKKIAACLIGLSIVLMLATVAFSVITFGTALLPMATLSAGIIAGVAGTAATAIAPIGAYSLFKSKDPRITKSINEYKKHYKSPKPDNRSDE